MEFQHKPFDDLLSSRISLDAAPTFLPALVLVAALFLLYPLVNKNAVNVGAPLVSPYTGRFVPTIIQRLKFHSSAQSIIAEGYRKYKDSMFRIQRTDTDLIVLSAKYCEELRALPEESLSLTEANVADLLGHYTAADILAESSLHSRVLLESLTPNLRRLIPRVIDELEIAFKAEFPNCTGRWAAVKLYDVVLHLVSRSAARIFVGEPLCRNKSWLDISITYTENVFMTVGLMKLFPPFLYPVVARLLPSYWRARRQLNDARHHLMPLIEARMEGDAAEKPDDFLQWMIDAASEKERDPEKLVRRQLIMTLGSIHTTTMAVVHVMYDLCSRPEYIAPLREEVGEHFAGGREHRWGVKASLTEMKLLDSFMKESQRLNPPSLLSFNRIVMKPIQLSDGLRLPKGIHICLPAGPIQLDPEVVDNADSFDGFRWYRRRQAGDAHRDMFVSTSRTSLNFGHGKLACPGRFFASNEIKCILSMLLLKYEFRFPESRKERPRNIMIEEKMMPDPNAIILFKELEGN